MADTAGPSWWPVTGRHSVTIGSSLTRTLKARKNEPPPNSRHERHYYAFRYQFDPDSIDYSKPGTVETRKVEAGTLVQLERAMVGDDERVALYKGDESEAAERELVLIYDEDSKLFTLEKVDSFARLNFDKKAPKKSLQASSPLPSSVSSTSASSPDSASLAAGIPKKSTPAVRTAVNGNDNGDSKPDASRARAQSPLKPPDAAVNKPVDLKKKMALAFRKTPRQPSAQKAAPAPAPKEEESEGEIVEKPRAPEPARKPAPAPATSSTPPPSKPPAKPGLSLAQAAASIRAQSKTPSTAPTPAPTTKYPLPAKPAAPTPSSQKPAKTSPLKRERPEESSTPSTSSAKRARPSPPPQPKARPQPAKKEVKETKEKVELAFPGSSSAGVALPAAPKPASQPTSLAFPGSSNTTPVLPPAPTAPAPMLPTYDSDDEDDDDQWDVVLPTMPTTEAAAPAPTISHPPPAPLHPILMEEIEPEPTVHLHDDMEDSLPEIDEEALAEDLENAFGEEEEEDDFLAAAISPVTEHQPMPPELPRGGAPLSMSQLAGAAGVPEEEDNLWGDDDETSSSDDSDDD